MGQCSTLPADTRPSPSSHHQHNSTSSARYETRGGGGGGNAYQISEQARLRQEERHRLSEGGRQESLDFNVIVTPEPTRRPAQYREQKQSQGPVVVVHHVQDAMQTDDQSRDPDQEPDQIDAPNDMEVDSRDQAPPFVPQPPEGAVRTRCYKLNLDSEHVGTTASQRQQMYFGPYTEPPPYLTYSSSSDSSEGVNPVKIAIKTAQIFRGITIARDGTILSQNARASRSSRSNKNKRGEKSRQAAKIDKAKDLVEEMIATGKQKDSDEPANMVSLVIMGEYDDMKQLVRDGSKKLREAEGLSDNTLLSINRPRHTPSNKTVRGQPVLGHLKSNSRKRTSASPNFVTSQRTAAMQSPEQVHVSVTSHPMSPPKLKGHPRDNRPTRREERANMRMRLDACNDFGQNGATGNGDWSHGWNIWNCGGSGTVSPLQPSSPSEKAKMVYEGREASYGGMREEGIAGRAN